VEKAKFPSACFERQLKHFDKFYEIPLAEEAIACETCLTVTLQVHFLFVGGGILTRALLLNDPRGAKLFSPKQAFIAFIAGQIFYLKLQ
jgi:hypothetical protein